MRRAVERLAAKPRGRRFVGEMRRDLVAYVRERRAAGASLSSIELIQRLYEIDTEAGDDDERRRELRATKASAVVDELYAWRLEQHPLSTSPTAQVLGYLENHKTGLRRFLESFQSAPLSACGNLNVTTPSGGSQTLKVCVSP